MINNEIKWEKIAWETYRLKVIGGWVIRIKEPNADQADTITCCFVPDEYHKWKVEVSA